jgi:hypothetical protein
MSFATVQKPKSVICHCTESHGHLPLYKRKCPSFATVQKEVPAICHCTKGSARYLPLYKRKCSLFATVQKEAPVICHCTKGSAPVICHCTKGSALVICHCTKGSARHLPLYCLYKRKFSYVPLYAIVTMVGCHYTTLACWLLILPLYHSNDISK